MKYNVNGTEALSKTMNENLQERQQQLSLFSFFVVLWIRLS